MPPKSKPEAQQASAKTVLDSAAQQLNSDGAASPDLAPGVTGSVGGPSSTDTPGPSNVEAQQTKGDGAPSPDLVPGTADAGSGQLSATALASVTGLSSTDTPGLSSADQPTFNRYKVTGVSSIQHDGTWYEAGDDICLTDRDALGLLDGRFIVPTQEF